MTDREKLIALYKQWWETPFDEEECEDCTENVSRCNECLYGKFADYLISHGVCIREKGEWYGSGDGYADGELVYDMWECGCCGHDTYTDEKPEWGFCSWCGADMRKENT